MSINASMAIGVRWLVSVIIVLALVVSWTAVAYAQTPTDAQYQSPTATASGNPAVSGISAGAGAGGGAGAASGGASGGSGGSLNATLLPVTGGLALPLIILSTLALGATGMLVVRQANRQ